ncbi:hypothetical protein DFH06DRAFT_1218302 [Mycena polygramma]|nr:hypothetical protein DFH06DRAFT_1218302 [Mycena polygramma]
MSISQLLGYDLPPVSSDSMEVDFAFFDAAEPADNIGDLLPVLTIPSCTVLNSINAGLGQAWFDGLKSIHTWINPGIACSFWLWTVLGWYGSLGAFGDMQAICLAALFLSDYLVTNIVDDLMAVLASRLRLSDDPRSNNTLIVDTTFALFLGMFPPIVDGTATGPIRASSSAQAYLKKYGTWFYEEQMRHLHLVLHWPPEHWTACSLDFSMHRAQYSDSLGWGCPKDFFDAMEVWLKETGHPDFSFADDLPCAKQTDGFNCPIIAVNAIAHRALGDPLWTAKSAKAMRMKAFCDLVKYALSTKVHFQFSRGNI